ncbi:Alpha-(1,3)-fucosyltransferase C [Orchesella cincta]|uniref:Fucosyltransferase n=1 Tax=Orchesella cincta TaxID=48709 RepID=A0A1D2MBZ8_ORCCI|nr:Alpha-(1,3)-fucosyltransferase C [Orchesella cincta]
MIPAASLSGRLSWRRFLYLFMVAFIFVSYQYSIIPSYDRKDITEDNSGKRLKSSSKTKPFTILFWTRWYGDDPVGFNKPECQPEFRIITNRSLYAEADVVMFQYVNLDPHGTDSEINTIFNETLKTYEKPRYEVDLWKQIFRKRQHGIRIDIYGKCGLYTCEKDGNCFAKLGEHYKFYLALENSLCVDYVTEKMYHALFHNMVPIVWALGQDLNNYAPPGSYINAMEFKSVSDLAKIIKFLDENPTEYFKYFEWRQMYNLSSIHDSDLFAMGGKKYNKSRKDFY